LLRYRYKAEGVIDADPETVFSYIEPSPDSPRSKWDKAVKELQIVETVDNVSIEHVCRGVHGGWEEGKAQTLLMEPVTQNTVGSPPGRAAASGQTHLHAYRTPADNKLAGSSTF